MPRYIIERQYLVPMFEHILVEAPTLEAACREAVDYLAQPWGEDAQLCFDDARETTITCAIELPPDYVVTEQIGDFEFSRPLGSIVYEECFETLPIPAEFQEREAPWDNDQTGFV